MKFLAKITTITLLTLMASGLNNASVTGLQNPDVNSGLDITQITRCKKCKIDAFESSIEQFDIAQITRCKKCKIDAVV